MTDIWIVETDRCKEVTPLWRYLWCCGDKFKRTEALRTFASAPGEERFTDFTQVGRFTGGNTLEFEFKATCDGGEGNKSFSCKVMFILNDSANLPPLVSISEANFTGAALELDKTDQYVVRIGLQSEFERILTIPIYETPLESGHWNGLKTPERTSPGMLGACMQEFIEDGERLLPFGGKWGVSYGSPWDRIFDMVKQRHEFHRHLYAAAEAKEQYRLEGVKYPPKEMNVTRAFRACYHLWERERPLRCDIACWEAWESTLKQLADITLEVHLKARQAWKAERAKESELGLEAGSRMKEADAAFAAECETMPVFKIEFEGREYSIGDLITAMHESMSEREAR